MPYYGEYTAMFPFFYIGVLCSRYDLVKSIVFESDRMYAFAVAFYFCAMLFLGGSRKMTGCFSIIILVQLFIRYDKHIPLILSRIGKYSLEIYAFHWFFLPSLPSLSNLISTPQAAGLPNDNFIVLLLTSLAFAIPIIGLCIALTICIRKSDLLNMLLFGFKKKNII
ncbi:MAG: acyltransferase family protein [Prevotella sp.]